MTLLEATKKLRPQLKQQKILKDCSTTAFLGFNKPDLKPQRRLKDGT
jgi:hypothetical protein